MTPEDFAKFQALVADDDHHREVECGAYLGQAAHILLPDTASDVRSIQEDRNHFGETDLIISADVTTQAGAQMRVAYVWEFKAPQCQVMENDRAANRFIPTKDLLQAENQLLHYSYLAERDLALRARLRVVDHAHIFLGGIVMGRSKSFVKNATGPLDVELAHRSLQIRESYFYRPRGMRLITWDWVLASVRPLGELAGRG